VVLSSGNGDRKTLVLGGIRSGKSALAEAQAAALGGAVVYVATATPGDDEMQARIATHQLRRPSEWSLHEEPLSLSDVLYTHEKSAPCLLIDCMSLWLSNLLHEGEDLMSREINDFLAALADYPGPVVIVSNEVGLGLVGMDAMTRRFCDQLGWLNQSLAARCDTVALSVAGLPQVLKGTLVSQDCHAGSGN